MTTFNLGKVRPGVTVSVTELAEGAEPTCAVTDSVVDGEQVYGFSFGLPKGTTGATGPTGASGPMTPVIVKVWTAEDL